MCIQSEARKDFNMILGVYNLATLVTYMGLLSSFFSMYFALNNILDVSLILFIAARLL